jgi:hypothetical protein
MIGVSQYGKWCEVRDPFRHFQASEVLPNEQYRAIEAEFQRLLDVTEGRAQGGIQLIKSDRNYDARMLPITEQNMDRFHPFFSESWLSSLCGLVKIPYIPRIDAALHSSPQNSRSGWIHTDFCSGWFDESRYSGTGILFPDRTRCHYFEGTPRTAGAKPAEYIRAATLIFYLCNDNWTQGDGGETGFYGSGRESQNTQTLLVAPINNRLILFECSPHSYHRFVSNPGRVRNSLILWLHCEVQSAEDRWGPRAINRRGKNV